MPLIADVDRVRIAHEITCEFNRRIRFNDEETFMGEGWDRVIELLKDKTIEIGEGYQMMNSTSKERSIENKQFINCIRQFNQEFKSNPCFNQLDYSTLSGEFKSSLSALLDIEPEVISLELTSDESVYYTLQKDNLTFFFQHFLMVRDDDADEAIVTRFKDNKYLGSYAGSLNDAINELYQNVPLPQNTVNVFNLAEVSA